MTKEILIEHVNQAIAKALQHASYIDASILDIRGFSTGIQRRLVSNLCHMPKSDPVYTECGLFGGASFCAAINNCPTLTAFGIEDYSQPFGDDSIKEHLEANLEVYRSGAKRVEVIDADFFKMDLSVIDKKVDIFFYDGCHDYEFQAKALPTMIEKMADLSLFLVDDAQWLTCREGSRDGFLALVDKVKCSHSWSLVDAGYPDVTTQWNNGLDIFLIEKLK